MPRGVRKAKPATAAKSTGPKADLFKTKDIKEDVLIDRVFAQSGVRKDDDTVGFVKAVLPRFAEANPKQAFSSMTKMVKEFGRGVAAFGNNNQSNGSDRVHAPSAQEVQPRRKPGPKPGKKSASGNAGNNGGNEKGQASGGNDEVVRRKPGRPKGSKNRPKHPQ